MPGRGPINFNKNAFQELYANPNESGIKVKAGHAGAKNRYNQSPVDIYENRNSGGAGGISPSPKFVNDKDHHGRVNGMNIKNLNKNTRNNAQKIRLDPIDSNMAPRIGDTYDSNPNTTRVGVNASMQFTKGMGLLSPIETSHA